MKSLQYMLCTTFLATGVMASAPHQERAPDNTAVNAPDRTSTSPTAGKSKNNQKDREIARDIRRDVVKDKNLSTYGHNVKVIAQNGRVTLRGPVHSEDEKKTIESYAQKHAGEGNVDNQLSVKGDRSKK